jgi:myosin V
LFSGLPESFRYTNQGGNALINGVDDVEAFEDTCSALGQLSFPQDQQYMMFRILAAILHLGDVQFVTLDQDSSAIVVRSIYIRNFFPAQI